MLSANSQRLRRQVIVAGTCVCSIGMIIYRTIQKATLYTNSADVFSIASRKGKLPNNIASLLDNTYSIGNKKLYFHYDKFQTNHQFPSAVALLHLGVSVPNITHFIHGIATEMLDTPEQYQLHNPHKDVLGEYPCTWDNLTQYTGKQYNYYGIRAMFVDDLKHKYNGDIHALLADRYPVISNGLVGGALHGLIHIGYGVAVDNVDAIIDGLAFTVFISNILSTHNENTWDNEGTLDFNELLEVIRGDAEVFHKAFIEHKNEFKMDTILYARIEILKKYLSKHMARYVAMLKKPNIASKKDVEAVSAWLMASAITLYTYSSNGNDFFLLHGVTSSWAMSHVLTCLNSMEDVKSVVDDFLLAIVYIYVVMGVPQVDKTINKSDDVRASIADVIHDKVVPNYQTGRNVCKKHIHFVFQEHQVKVCQVLMDCLERNIIEEQTAYDGVLNVTNVFSFDSGKIWDS